MTAEIIGVGAALSEEESLRESTRIVARELEACGIQVCNQSAVGVSTQRLQTAIARALERADVVILLGGLGAGADGIAKGAVCEGLGRRLVLHEESLRRIQMAYQKAGRQMPQQITRLAMLPEQSMVFPGVRGITPGCALSAGDQFILMLPDDPREFVPMFQRSVVPYLAKFSNAGVFTRTVNIFGMQEGALRETLGAILQSQNPVVELCARRGEFLLRITTRAGSKEEAAALCAPVSKEIFHRLGEAAYGADQQGGLPAAAVAGLLRKRLTLSVGESGTDGMLAGLLAVLPDSGQLLLFSVPAESDSIKRDALKVPEKLLKKCGAESAAVAAAMAFGAKTQGGSSLGLSICGRLGGEGDPKKTGIATIALCNGEAVWLRKLALPKNESVEQLKLHASLAALNLLRLYAAALPGILPGSVPLKTALSGKAEAASALPAPAASARTNAPRKTAEKRPFLSKLFPWKGDPAAEVVRKMILLVAICVFLGSAGYLGNFQLEKMRQAGLEGDIQAMYNQAAGVEDEAKIEVPSGYPKDYQKKFANLYKTNEDVAGWLSIPDTQVNYAVVQYQNNDYYLRRDFKGNDSKYGTPWLEAANLMAPQQDNYVIYAHNMTDGKMFGELMNYKGAKGTKEFANPTVGLAYLKEHPLISFDDVYRDNDYQIVSVFITNAKAAYGDIFFYNSYLDLSKQADFDTFVGEIKARSYYTSDVDIQKGDKFLTLSTCSYEFGPVSDDAHVRTVVVARRLRDGEKRAGTTYGINPKVKLPPGFTGGNTDALVKQADAESKGNLAMDGNVGSSHASKAPAPGNSAAGTPGNPAQASSGTANLSEVQVEAKAASAQAQSAAAEARDARDAAEKAERNAVRANTAKEARKAADQAYAAQQDAEYAYNTALDALDTVELLYEQHADIDLDLPYQATQDAVSAAKKYRNAARDYASSAETAAIEAESSSSSKVESSSSSKVESSPSSKVESSSSSKVESSSSSKAESSAPHPSTPEPPLDPTNEQPPKTETPGAD